MVTIDYEKCTTCGICLNRFKGYCISRNTQNGKPEIDYALCNQCQKCIALCPQQAFLMNGTRPEKITEPLPLKPDILKELLSRRRSIKKFKNMKIPKDTLLELASVARYAPNQNKNIGIIIIDDEGIIQAIDQSALKFVNRIYKILFSIKPLTGFCKLFSKSLGALKRKMEYDLHLNRHIVKENTQALFVLTGDPKVPVTETSAQYLLATMVIYAEALGIGTCLMDSLKHSINVSRPIKQLLGIPKGRKVLGVLAAGYSNEKIVNKPLGYEIEIHWNGENGRRV